MPLVGSTCVYTAASRQRRFHFIMCYVSIFLTGSICRPGDTCPIRSLRDPESAAPDATTFTHVHG